MERLQKLLEDLSNFNIKVEKGQVKILGKSGFACIGFTHYNSTVFVMWNYLIIILSIKCLEGLIAQLHTFGVTLSRL